MNDIAIIWPQHLTLSILLHNHKAILVKSNKNIFIIKPAYIVYYVAKLFSFIYFHLWFYFFIFMVLIPAFPFFLHYIPLSYLFQTLLYQKFYQITFSRNTSFHFSCFSWDSLISRSVAQRFSWVAVSSVFHSLSFLISGVTKATS